jgi:hypothetical protein
MLGIKHVLLVGNDAGHLLSVQNRMLTLRPQLEIDISDICTVDAAIHKQQPDLIMVCVEEVGCFDFLDLIRKNKRADETPLIVCRNPLEERILESILNRLAHKN